MDARSEDHRARGAEGSPAAAGADRRGWLEAKRRRTNDQRPKHDLPALVVGHWSLVAALAQRGQRALDACRRAYIELSISNLTRFVNDEVAADYAHVGF